MSWVSLMRCGLPKAWRGLCTTFGSPAREANSLECWWRKARESRISGRLAWEDLVLSIVRDEPRLTEAQQQLQFTALLFHLPPCAQNQLLSFIYTHREQVPVRALQKLFDILHAKPSHCDTRSDSKQNREQTPETYNDEWLRYWTRKFSEYLSDTFSGNKILNCDEDVLNKEDSQSGRYMYRFSECNEERKNGILERICGLLDAGSEDSSSRNPWSCALWATKRRHSEVEIPSPPRSQADAVPSSPAAEAILVDSDPDQDRSTESQSADPETCEVAPDTPGPAAKKLRKEYDPSEESVASEADIIPEHILLSVRCISEAWMGGVEAASQDLVILAHSSVDELQEVCRILDLSQLPESCLANVTTQLASLRDQLPHSHARLLASHSLSDRVVGLESVASRTLHLACVILTEAYPAAVVQAVLLPVLNSTNAGVHQSDLVVKLVKDSLPPDGKHKLLREYVETGAPLTTTVIAVLQAVIDSKLSLEGSTFDQLVAVLQQNSERHRENLKYGKLVLAVVKHYSSMMKSAHINQLTQAMEVHKTFLKKSVMGALNKIKL